MVESRIHKKIVIIFVIITSWSNVLIYIGEIHNGILPKFISASYKENLKMEFNSIFLKQIFNLFSKFFKINPATTSFLIGDLPIYKNAKSNMNYTMFKKLHEEEEEIVTNIKHNQNIPQKYLLIIILNTFYFQIVIKRK